MSVDRLGAYGSRRVWVVAVLVAVLFTLLGTPRPAEAHNALVGTTPTDGATVAEPPAAVVLTFNEPAIATGTKVLVTGPDGSAASGAPKLVDTTVQQELLPGLAAGEYTVEWRVTSADGHPVNGTFSFQVRSGASSTGASEAGKSTPATPVPEHTDSASPSSAGAGDASSGPSGWLWLLVLIPVALAAVLGWRFSRR